MKKALSVLGMVLLVLVYGSCGEFFFGSDAYVHIFNDFGNATLVQWTDVDGLIVDPCVTGLYVGDADTDTWGSNLMDYEIAPGDDGTVPLAPIENQDLKIVVQDRFSAGNIGLMSSHARTFTYLRENLTIEASRVEGGYTTHIP